jgi:hypothetical protein
MGLLCEHSADTIATPADIKLSSTNSEIIEKQPRNTSEKEVNVEQINCSDIVKNTSVEINGCVSMNDGQTDCNINSKSMDQKPSKKRGDTKCERESVNGDISNLSALEDEGWQSQARRSHRKKKKELAGRSPRERSQSNQKNKKNFQKDHKQNNFKKQNSKNTVNNRNENGMLKETLKTNIPTDITKDNKDGLSPISAENKEEKDKSQEAAKPAFPYRDALLRTKPKASGTVGT